MMGNPPTVSYHAMVSRPQVVGEDVPLKTLKKAAVPRFVPIFTVPSVSVRQFPSASAGRPLLRGRVWSQRGGERPECSPEGEFSRGSGRRRCPQPCGTSTFTPKSQGHEPGTSTFTPESQGHEPNGQALHPKQAQFLGENVSLVLNSLFKMFCQNLPILITLFQ